MLKLSFVSQLQTRYLEHILSIPSHLYILLLHYTIYNYLYNIVDYGSKTIIESLAFHRYHFSIIAIPAFNYVNMYI